MSLPEKKNGMVVTDMDKEIKVFWTLVECALPGYKEQYHRVKENGNKIIERLEL